MMNQKNSSFSKQQERISIISNNNNSNENINTIHNPFLDDYSDSLFGKSVSTKSKNKTPKSKQNSFFITSMYRSKKYKTKDSFFLKSSNGVLKKKKNTVSLRNNEIKGKGSKRKTVGFNLKNGSILRKKSSTYKNITSLAVKKDDLRCAVESTYKNNITHLLKDKKLEFNPKNEENPLDFLNKEQADNIYKKSKTTRKKEKQKKWLMFQIKNKMFTKMKTETPSEYINVKLLFDL